MDEIDWTQMVDPTVLKHLSAEEIKRQQIIFELITTETAYVMDLEVVMEVIVTSFCCFNFFCFLAF